MVEPNKVLTAGHNGMYLPFSLVTRLHSTYAHTDLQTWCLPCRSIQYILCLHLALDSENSISGSMGLTMTMTKTKGNQ